MGSVRLSALGLGASGFFRRRPVRVSRKGVTCH